MKHPREKVYLLIDCSSSSFHNSDFEKCINIAVATLKKNKSVTSISCGYFNEKLNILFENKTREELSEIQNMEKYGLTAINDHINSAIDFLGPNNNKNKLIHHLVIISDEAQDNNSILTNVELAAIITPLQKSRKWKFTCHLRKGKSDKYVLDMGFYKKNILYY